MPDIAALVQDHGYWVLGLIVLLENAGVPVPGETALLAAGYLTSADGGHLHIGAVIAVGFLAAILGDNLGFWLGRRVARPRLDAGRRFLFLTPARMATAERHFERYGALTVFFARFVTGLRVVAGPAAGASAMGWGRFLVANAAGALTWAVAVALVGHYAGHAWGAMRERLGHAAWTVVAVLVGAFVIWRVRAYRREKDAPQPTGSLSGRPRAQRLLTSSRRARRSTGANPCGTPSPPP